MTFLFFVLYAIGIRAYYFGVVVSSLWNSKAKQWRQGRKNLFEKIESSLKPNEHRVWFHCASVGEFEQGRPVMEAYRKKFRQHKIVLTFFSPSGFELRKNYSGDDYIFYLPLDTKANAGRFISLIDPEIAVFVKYEFWFHFLSEIQRRKIPAVMISAVFRKNHFLFNTVSSPLKRVTMDFRKIFVQDELSFQLLRGNNFTNAVLAGDTRFDRVWEIASLPEQIPLIATFRNKKKLFVGGSTWAPDEKLILQLVTELNDEWKFVIVPHEIYAAHLEQLKRESAWPVIFYSEIDTGKKISNEKILIVDKIGLLSSIYQYANIAYVGGGFGKGIHNTLEAAVYGIPVLFGPNYEKFNEAKLLIENKGASAIKNFEELKAAFQFYQQPENNELGKSNRYCIQRNTGATKVIVSFLEELNSNIAASRA